MVLSHHFPGCFCTFGAQKACIFKGFRISPKPSKLIPTRQMKPPSKLFCIGDLIPFDLIWYPLSKSYRVSDFLLSKSYRGPLSKVALVSVYQPVNRWKRECIIWTFEIYIIAYFTSYDMQYPWKLLLFLQSFCTSILTWNCPKRNDWFVFHSSSSCSLSFPATFSRRPLLGHAKSHRIAFTGHNSVGFIYTSSKASITYWCP